jgi:hypothetical protein
MEPRNSIMPVSASQVRVGGHSFGKMDRNWSSLVSRLIASARPETGTWGITDGSAGLRGRLLKTDDLAEVKLFIASLLSGAAEAFTQKQVSPFGTFALPTLQNAGLQGAQSVLDRYAQQILQTIERDGFYVRVPAGKQFYLYITQTIDEQDAKIGGTLPSSLSTESPSPSPTPQRSFATSTLLGTDSMPTDSNTSTPQPNVIP